LTVCQNAIKIFANKQTLKAETGRSNMFQAVKRAAGWCKAVCRAYEIHP